MSPETTPFRTVLLDVDGTLVNTRTVLPDSAADAVRRARANGHRLFLCTGRSRPEIYPHLWELGFDGLIGGNGSYIELAGEPIFVQTLDADVVREAVEWMDSLGLGYYLEATSGLWMNERLMPEMARLMGDDSPAGVAAAHALMPVATDRRPERLDDVNKISFALPVGGVDLEALARRFQGRAKIDTWSMNGLVPEFGEIGQIGIDKGAAAARLAAHLGADRANLIAFGDARSDLPLFAACGTSVAMGNAPDSVKAEATMTTSHVDEDGLARAFAALNLI
ncbi:Cof-type HAD-IIB family hydrolase [Luteococcus sp. H138]|uniref:Cof-type HAD-IIB family hydrolase n=1 Tax=unclassified Luteococcus TaxID=2639923 RepID=UPI00313DA06E